MLRVTVTFPVLEYFAPYSDGSGTTVTHVLLEHPKRTQRIWGIPREGWVTGLMDCNGLDIPVTRIGGSFERASWSRPLGRIGAFPYSMKYHYGVPRRLTVDQFRGKVISLVMKTASISRHINQIKQAKTYRGVMLGCFGGEQHFPLWRDLTYRDIFFRLMRDGSVQSLPDPPLTMEIEVPEPGEEGQ